MKKAAIGIAFIVIVAALYFLLSGITRPSVRLVSVSSDSIVSMKDTLAIILAFDDRDGDIGDRIKSPSMAYVEDTAYRVVQTFPIISTAFTHSIGPVTGRLRVLVDLLPLLDTSLQRTTKLKVYITDRKGHKSNVVETGDIHISRIEF